MLTFSLTKNVNSTGASGFIGCKSIKHSLVVIIQIIYTIIINNISPLLALNQRQSVVWLEVCLKKCAYGGEIFTGMFI